MNGSRSLQKRTGIFAVSAFVFSVVMALSFFAAGLRAQVVTTNNQFIWASVDGQSGFVTVLIPPGRPVYDPQLSFQNKSYFTCSIAGTFFTNNEVIPNPPANTKKLTDGVTTKIWDTVRTIWADRNGVDIIQDIYPVAFTKSGQIVYKWKFKNNTGSPISIPCQYLQDIQITDPKAAQPNSSDGPTILTKWSYKNLWQQFPNPSVGQSLPWFYIGFLYTLPHAPSLDPGLSGMGYMDYGAPLNLIKPFRMTIGDWYVMASTIFGQGAWPFGTSYGAPPQVDDAVLVEFAARGVGAGQTVEVGRTSYGTGEYEKCVGSLFSIVFYPHHLVWTKSNAPPPGFYTPNPIHIEKFVVNPDKINSSANTKITLTVGDDMTLSDSICKSNFGKSQTKPTIGNGIYLGPGDVGYFDWWACTSPALFCTGADIDSLIFTATCGVCPPGFLNSEGAFECDQQIIIDCAETDLDAPEYSDTLLDGCRSASINVHDWRPTDRGLKSIIWAPAKGTDSSKFVFTGPTPAVKPCYTDKLNHIVTITKIDSTVGGCFDFTFEDCLGHQSFHTVCLSKCIVGQHPDSLPPVFTLVKKWGTYDSTFTCYNGLGDNNRVDSFEVTDNRKNDSGICTLNIIPGSRDNMQLNISPFTSGSQLVRFSVSVQDSMRDGNICIRATDCSKAAHYTDTCFHYCTIKDTLAPRITISKSKQYAGLWSVVVKDDTAWDRHIDSIYIIGPAPMNLHVNQTANNFISDPVGGRAIYSFTITSNDTTKETIFCVEATDSAKNRSVAGAHCGRQTISKDTICPNIVINPNLNTNPIAITVDVNDIHFNPDSSKYVWDSGVDSVWFTFNHGMKDPGTKHGNGAMTIPQFPVSVINPNDIDSVACVTINAVDMNGNWCDTTYCFPYTPDIMPPVITLWYNTDTVQIFGIVTDSAVADRGLASISLFHNIPGGDTNLSMTPIKLLGNKVQIIDASNSIKRDPRRSSVGSVHVLDRWGFIDAPTATQHTASVDFAFWVQDFGMKKAIQPDQGSTFFVPVYFVKNDSFRVRRKDITDFSLTFTMTGDVTSIVFDSASQIGTEMQIANWNQPLNQPKWVVNGNTITVTGTSTPGGTQLASIPLQALPLLSNADSVVLLYFHALPSQSTSQVNLTVDSLVLNHGKDTTYVGTASGIYFSTARMPAPYGSSSGSTIVITGACAPKLVSDNAHPSSVSLDPNHPNPFSHITTFNYTVAEQGPVRIAIYDVLGREITRIVDQEQKQGTYTVTFDGSMLSGGNYVARLETGGVVVSRRVAVAK